MGSTQKIGNATILNVDCMEYMRSLPDKYFDLAVCDPPYGIKASSGSSTNKTMREKIAQGKIKGGDWDNSIPRNEYFEDLFRVSKEQIIWGGNYFFLRPSKCFLIWDKGESIYGRDFAECEFAWGSFDRCARIYKLFPNQAERIHPTQKPVKLYEWILTNYAKPGQKIFDSHMGSGSSAIAANNLGFEYVGCELDTDYYEAACKRIAHHASQERLFA